MPYCRNCGVQLPEDAQYCTNCGVQLPEKTQYCTNCGVQLPEKANYCPKCATPKNPPPIPPTTSQPIPPPPIQPQKTTNTSQHKDLLTLSTLIMLIILITALIIALITLTPFLQINFGQNPFEQPGINHLNIITPSTTNNLHNCINPQDSKPWTSQQLTAPIFLLTFNTTTFDELLIPTIATNSF